jgi:methylmalonyl-CoA mutase cobalamin-binding domain/chain
MKKSRGVKSRQINMLRERTARFADLYGRRPRILITRIHAKCSDRDVKTIATAFADMGFDADINITVQSQTDILRLALENDVHTVGIPGISGADRTQISELITIFNTKHSGSILLAFWTHNKSHGIMGLSKVETVRIEIFDFDTDTTICANRILDVLEQQS